MESVYPIVRTHPITTIPNSTRTAKLEPLDGGPIQEPSNHMAVIYLHLGMAHSPHGEGYWDEQWELLLVSLLKGRSLLLHSHKDGPALAGPSVDFFSIVQPSVPRQHQVRKTL